MPLVIVPDPEDGEDVVQLAASEPPTAAPEDRWAFSSSTIRRVCIAGIMFWVSKQDFAQFVDQQLVADVVEMGFGVLGTVYLALAGRARQLGGRKGPENIYWLPRLRPS